MTITKTETAPTHDVSIQHEGPTQNGAFSFGGGYRANCSCGWWSDCYSQMSDTQRAVEVHLRKSRRTDFDALIARSSIGAAIDDVKKRGIDAHLIDLERETHVRRRARKAGRSAKKKRVAQDAAFLRGFGCALASIWRCHHDSQMVECLLKENSLKLDDFRNVELLDGDWNAICQAAAARRSA